MRFYLLLVLQVRKSALRIAAPDSREDYVETCMDGFIRNEVCPMPEKRSAKLGVDSREHQESSSIVQKRRLVIVLIERNLLSRS